eukprot:TRINITY_DN881_c0_g1_i1.p1 TRINITY_DN881_c0_g1~~TRINITY_DN881_c0_g1_i1.p1  ORF type:complete len:361 (-),score=78.44 TRINITY_DN881_c0_g1_i1:97-1179(-)
MMMSLPCIPSNAVTSTSPACNLHSYSYYVICNVCRGLVIFIAIIVGALLSLFGMCGAVRKSSCCTQMFVAFGFLFVLGVWALMGFHLSANVAISDFCVVSDDYVHDWDRCESENEKRVENLVPLLDCSSPEQSPQASCFSKIAECYGKEDQNALVLLTWENIATLLYADTNDEFDPSATPSSPTDNSIRGLINRCTSIDSESVGMYRTVFNDSTTLIKGFPGAEEGEYIDIVVNRGSLQKNVSLSSSCSDVEKSLFEDLIASYVGFLSVSDDVMRVTGCWYMRDLIGNVNDAICGSPQDQLDYLCVSLIVIGILFIFCLVMSVKGLKRYPDRSNEMENDEEFGEKRKQRQHVLGNDSLFT